MHLVDQDEQVIQSPTGTYTKPINSSRRRASFSRRRWIKLMCLISTLTLFAFYFGYYSYYYHSSSVSSPRTTLKKLITTVTNGSSISLEPHQQPITIPVDTWSEGQPRGVLYMIVRNENLPEARAAMRVIQDRFNHLANYPWVLLNNQRFNDDFIRHTSAVLAHSNTSIFFGKIDADTWTYPSWVDIPKAENALWDLVGVKHGESLSHHQMYQAGSFHHHPLFTNVEYTWRIEPGSMYTCALTSDPFRLMKKENKKMGFVLTTKEDPKAIQSLWSTTRNFMEKYPHLIKPRNQTILPWLMNENGDYNHCHMWSNLEILDLSFVRSDAYQAYFNHLDLTSGFFYEKWGDPVRTLAAALFLDKRQVHFFDQVGYTHETTSYCPFNSHASQQCTCDATSSHDMHESSCTFELLRYIDPPAFNALIHRAQSKLPPHIRLDLNNTDILKQVIKEKDQLISFLKDHQDLSFTQVK